MTSSKSTKRALISSVLAMLLCAAMLIGATFAWFTDTASTAVNKIQAGNLDVDIVDMQGNSLDGKTLTWQKPNDAANEDVLWEPGCTYYLTPFHIQNKGNLALKFKVLINGVSGDNKLLEALEFGFYYFQPGFGDMRPLEELAAGDKLDNVADYPGVWTAPIYIVAHMKEDAGNEYQGLSIDGIGITVVATQYTYESDSFGNTYDKDASLDFVPVSTTDELKAVFANAADGEDISVSLTDDIDLGADKTLMIVDENSSVGDINIQANGHTVKNAVAGARVLQIAKSDTERTITITGAKIVSEGAVTSNENRGVQIFSVDNATVNLVNCDIEMKANDYSYPVKIGGTSKNTTVNITGCTLTGANCIESFGTNCTVNITDCVLNSNYAPNETYCGNGIQDKNGTNNTYNIKNTTFNGTNAQPWEKSATTVIDDLGGNVYNTTRTTE